VTSSWCFLSTLNYDARSATHQMRNYRLLKATVLLAVIYLNCGFSIPLCVPIVVYIIRPSLHNNVVPCLYYVTNNCTTCFDPKGPSSGLYNSGINQGTCGNTTYGVPWSHSTQSACYPEILRSITLPSVLDRCDSWSVILREDHRLRVFENRVLRALISSNRDEVTGD